MKPQPPGRGADLTRCQRHAQTYCLSSCAWPHVKASPHLQARLTQDPTSSRKISLAWNNGLDMGPFPGCLSLSRWFFLLCAHRCSVFGKHAETGDPIYGLLLSFQPWEVQVASVKGNREFWGVSGQESCLVLGDDNVAQYLGLFNCWVCRSCGKGQWVDVCRSLLASILTWSHWGACAPLAAAEIHPRIHQHAQQKGLFPHVSKSGTGKQFLFIYYV